MIAAIAERQRRYVKINRHDMRICYHYDVFNDRKGLPIANFSLRGVDDATTSRLKAEASRQGMSVNAFLLRLIRQQLDLSAPRAAPRQYHDLDHLAGTWSAAEASALLHAVADFNAIDPELWR